MTNLLFLIPVALALGGLGLLAFLWSVRTGQYEDLEGASRRILLDDRPPGDLPTEADGEGAGRPGGGTGDEASDGRPRR